jgi:hypothetical protein
LPARLAGLPDTRPDGRIVTGLFVMMAGNVAEFWFFSEQAYGEINGRNLAWIGVLLGLLAALIGLLILGLAARRQGSLPQWSGLVFCSRCLLRCW